MRAVRLRSMARCAGDIFYCGTIRLGPHASLNGTLKRVTRMRTIETDAAPAEQVADQFADRLVNQAARQFPERGFKERADSNVTDISKAIA